MAQQQITPESLGLGNTKKRTAKWFIPAGVIIIGLAAWWLWPSNAGPDMRNTQFKTDAAVLGDLTITVNATGNIEPKDSVEVSSEQSGIVNGVFVDYNDHVTQGQVLAQLDTSLLQADVDLRQSSLKSAKAQVLEAKASLELAELDYAHYQEVWENSQGKAPSKQTLYTSRLAVDKAKANLLNTEAGVETAEANLASAQSDLVKATIKSPIEGVVLARDVEVGNTVAASLSAPTLFIIAKDLTDMELHVDIDEADIGQIALGQRAKFTVDAYPNDHFRGEVSQIRYASTDDDDSSSVVSYETVILVKNPELKLLPNMTAVTDIIVKSERQALTIANAALRYEPPRPEGAPEGGMPGGPGAGNREKGQEQERGGFMSSLMPGPPRGFRSRKKEQPESKEASNEGKQAVIWVLRDNRPMPVDVTLGISDGLRTQVTTGELQAGDLVITDSVSLNQ